MITVVDPLTLTLAKAIGVYMIAAGLSGLLDATRWRAIVDEIKAGRALTYFAGVAAFVTGTAIVIAHNIFTDVLATIVTLIGWAGIVEGLILIVWPKPLLDLGAAFVRPSAARIWGIAAVVFGVILLLLGLTGRAGPIL